MTDRENTEYGCLTKFAHLLIFLALVTGVSNLVFYYDLREWEAKGIETKAIIIDRYSEKYLSTTNYLDISYRACYEGECNDITKRRIDVDDDFYESIENLDEVSVVFVNDDPYDSYIVGQEVESSYTPFYILLFLSTLITVYIWVSKYNQAKVTNNA